MQRHCCRSPSTGQRNGRMQTSPRGQWRQPEGRRRFGLGSRWPCNDANPCYAFNCAKRLGANGTSASRMPRIAQRLFQVATGLLQSALALLGEALRFLPAAADRLARMFLQLAQSVFDGASDLILVHGMSFERAE